MTTSGDRLETQPFDPLLRDIDLPLSATYYPMGFRLQIRTNSRDVLEAATESWGLHRPEFEREPLEFRIVVQPQGELAAEPSFRSQRHLFSVVSDPDNFVVYDSRSLFAYGFLSAKTAADHAWFRWFFLESAVYMLMAQRHVVPVHAACVARSDLGVMLCGASGAGKSTLAFACARAGWTYICDDATMLLLDAEARSAIGRPYQVRFRDDVPGLFPELEGYAVQARPHGKLSIEVPLSSFPQIRTATRCRIGCTVLLERRSVGAARAEAISPSEVVESLLQDMPSYEEEVRARHRRTIGKLLEVPAYRLEYDTLDEAVRLLSRIAGTPEGS